MLSISSDDEDAVDQKTPMLKCLQVNESEVFTGGINPLTTRRAHGHEVLVTTDDKLVGVVIPFAVIFTGRINPLFWEHVVSIGAFDLPSSDIDLTHF
ncbi:hypothetical protein L2E82_43086 [Cichorium intybus]|uniref:Uncharacterized protein n=1 Tax=Cichorium intybus TaxID=13427 RepID=A0ACB8ZP28_CICIN|nr:hypothetical protein L2E82_43086 [Cichorium intybus]